jgi:hypothetical protein
MHTCLIACKLRATDDGLEILALLPKLSEIARDLSEAQKMPNNYKLSSCHFTSIIKIYKSSRN